MITLLAFFFSSCPHPQQTASSAFPLLEFVVSQSIGHVISGFGESKSKMERYSSSDKEEDHQNQLWGESLVIL
jgi:hypothetical protein